MQKPAITTTGIVKKSILNILLADDDPDDRFFFRKALEDINFPFKLVTVIDAERLISHLNSEKSPDILFLDLNMPRINGLECLSIIKSNKTLIDFPVVIYSTALDNSIADILYKNGAHFYLQKEDYFGLVNSLQLLFGQMNKKQFERPSRDNFIFNSFKKLL
jgi:CheY-like chemotaxis protein